MESVEVNFGVDANFIKNVSTRDITPLECIFDLIDNSIDAARDSITSTEYLQDEYGLPSDYSNYSIDIFISEDEIKIKDNCKGLSRDDLESSAFITGKESNTHWSFGSYNNEKILHRDGLPQYGSRD